MQECVKGAVKLGLRGGRSRWVRGDAWAIAGRRMEPQALALYHQENRTRHETVSKTTI
jgi:hypothetical protein